MALALLAGCSNYVSRSGEIRDAMAADDYESAMKSVEQIDHSNSKLLYLYEKGLVSHCQGDFETSSRVFTESELVLEDLYTKSITREAASLLVSETINQYRGDAFEAVYVNYYQILNYLGRGDIEGAMVECRRVNRKLQMLHDGGETYFTNDPFMSRRHAAVTRDVTTGVFSLRDLGSSNGTYLAIRGEQELNHGDHLRIGQHLFRLDVGRAKR